MKIPSGKYKVDCRYLTHQCLGSISVESIINMLETRNCLQIAQSSEVKVDNRLYFKLKNKYYSQDSDGDTLLHDAILCMDPNIVEVIIRIAPSSAFLDIQNNNLETPLHIAAKNCQHEVVRCLLAAGCLASPRDSFGDSPLHIACRNGDLKCIDALTDPSNGAIDLELWNYAGQTCIHVATVNGHIDVLRYLYELGGDVNAREGLMGYTPLHLAVERSDASLIKFLLRECPKLDLDVLSYGGLTASQIIPKDFIENDGESGQLCVLNRFVDKLLPYL